MRAMLSVDVSLLTPVVWCSPAVFNQLFSTDVCPGMCAGATDQKTRSVNDGCARSITLLRRGRPHHYRLLMQAERPTPPHKQRCAVCFRAGHMAGSKECQFSELVCLRCGAVGHPAGSKLCPLSQTRSQRAIETFNGVCRSCFEAGHTISTRCPFVTDGAAGPAEIEAASARARQPTLRRALRRDSSWLLINAHVLSASLCAVALTDVARDDSWSVVVPSCDTAVASERALALVSKIVSRQLRREQQACRPPPCINAPPRLPSATVHERTATSAHSTTHAS